MRIGNGNLIGSSTAFPTGTIAVGDLADGTDGEVLTWDAAGVIATAGVGTSGQVLTSNGVGAAPTMQTVAGGFVGSPVSFDAAINAAVNDDGPGVSTPAMGTEYHDLGNDYNTSTYVFTAPEDGTYQFNYGAGYTFPDAASSRWEVILNTTNRNYDVMFLGLWSSGPGNNRDVMFATVCTEMDQNDTASVTCSYTGGGSNADVTYGHFSGFRVA